MPRETHEEYFARRERECRDAADRAEDIGLKQIHRKFADHYATAIVRPEQSAAA